MTPEENFSRDLSFESALRFTGLDGDKGGDIPTLSRLMRERQKWREA
jgi:hypothetical protein